jgi:glycosyltransferase involved in cell wall biosynthesis
MASPDNAGPPAAVCEDDRALLVVSGLLDEVSYRARAGIPEETDAAMHYLEVGWLRGLDPREGFEGEFLRPFYETVGRRGPPVLVWLEFSARGDRAPSTRGEAEALAELVRRSECFDEDSYSRLLPEGMDPALHYVVVGEREGWRPSERFDPAFYLERYDDIAAAGEAPLAHYERWGRREGRRALPAAARLSFPPAPDRERRVVLILLHDATRTGAPILGWNLTRLLADRYHVVAVLMRGGELEEDFAAACAAVVGPMLWDEWHPAEFRRVADRLVTTYDPLYVIANSIETKGMVPPLVARGVPTVALVHEFAAYTRPLVSMLEIYEWAQYVIFPAQLVAESSFEAFPHLSKRQGVRVLAQGRVDLPTRHNVDAAPRSGGGIEADLGHLVRPKGTEDAFVVLGIGTVDLRKGVDQFLSTAAAVQRMQPELRCRFVWIGQQYDPEGPIGLSTFLAEQIKRSGLQDVVVILGPVDDLEPAYATANIFFMCSRLDPQPNVGIDAVTRGIPTVCFEGACGTAEVLGADPETRALVVPYLDTHAAAHVICHLAGDRAFLEAMGTAVARVGQMTYNMAAYVEKVDSFGRAAAAALRAEDLYTLTKSKIVDASLALPTWEAHGAPNIERYVLAKWAVVGLNVDQDGNAQFRRPCAGFHPYAYAAAHPDACGGRGQHPLVHWLRAGRPPGLWSHRVFSPLAPPAVPVGMTPRVALHAHFYYTNHAADLARKLARNSTPCTLWLTTDTEAKAMQLRTAFVSHLGPVEVRIVPNRGRNIAPFLLGFDHEIASGDFDVVGHVHAKQSISTDTAMGDAWREFLWQNLVGGDSAALDLAAAAFATEPRLGLLMAEDPNLVGWGRNHGIAETLAARMGIPLPLPRFFDFPLGAMFWARPAALRPLLDLGLASEDYPPEPLPDDGTLVHALERLFPFAASCAGLETASVRLPGTTW